MWPGEGALNGIMEPSPILKLWLKCRQPPHVLVIKFIDDQGMQNWPLFWAL